MNRAYIFAVAGLLIGLVIGAAIVWVVKPTPAPEPESAKPIKIGLILATGGLGDKSFNDISYAGVLQAKSELNITLDKAEPKAIAEYEGFQTNFAKTGEYALIVCVGYDQADALNKTAAAYPNQNFAIVDMVVDQPNVASLLFKENEGSFLVGAIGGMMTQTRKVGFVGGIDIPMIRNFFVGYQAGVRWANSSVTVLDPVFVGGWADPTKGYELAMSLITQGADVIFAAAGKSGLGALQAIHEQGKIGFGVDSCQDYLYPEIKASMTKRVDTAIFEMIKAAVMSKVFPDLTTGGFAGGVYNKGVRDGWTGCSRLPEEEGFWETTFNFTETPLASNVLAKLEDAKDGIISGQIQVPSGYA